MSDLKENIENTKNLWCRDARVKNIISILNRNPFRQGRGCHIRECNKTDCRGAHTKEEIKILPHLLKWDRLDKSTVNFPEIYFEIITVINDEKSKLKLVDSDKVPVIVAEKTIKLNLNELNFIELIQLWRELACYYRKISKETQRRKDWKFPHPPKLHQSGYIYSDEVPGFYLSDKLEDYIWALERMTNYCKKQIDFVENIKNKQYITIWDICLGDKNCKEGVHYLDEILCIDDFLTGTCNCMPSKTDEINKEIEKIKSTFADINIKPKQKEQLTVELRKNLNKLDMAQRSIHYTEQGMKSFNIQLENYNKEKEEEKKKLELELEKNKKPWDHDLLKQDSPIGKVKKIGLKTPRS